MHTAEKKITSAILMVFSFRVMADHSPLCCFAANPMNRPIAVPAKAPSATAIRIPNTLALMQLLPFSYPFIDINYPAFHGPQYLSIIFWPNYALCLFSAYIPYQEQHHDKSCKQWCSCRTRCMRCLCFLQGYGRKSDSNRQGLSRNHCYCLLQGYVAIQ